MYICICLQVGHLVMFGNSSMTQFYTKQQKLKVKLLNRINLDLVCMQSSTLQEAVQDQTCLSRYGERRNKNFRQKWTEYSWSPHHWFFVCFETTNEWRTNNQNHTSPNYRDYANNKKDLTASSISFGIRLLKVYGIILMLPVLVRGGMVPRLRALLRRPGREEGDALRSRGLCWRLRSLEKLGGRVGTKESTSSGESKGGWLPKGGAAELPARYLQHKSNGLLPNYNKTALMLNKKPSYTLVYFSK